MCAPHMYICYGLFQYCWFSGKMSLYLNYEKSFIIAIIANANFRHFLLAVTDNASLIALLITQFFFLSLQCMNVFLRVWILACVCVCVCALEKSSDDIILLIFSTFGVFIFWMRGWIQFFAIIFSSYGVMPPSHHQKTFKIHLSFCMCMRMSRKNA